VLIVDDLESRGLAERRRSPTDRRRHALYISEAGESLLGELLGVLREVEGQVLMCLSAAELKTLRALLDRIYRKCFREESA
jgi:DNA-binding MarR family transcriptional regulator